MIQVDKYETSDLTNAKPLMASASESRLDFENHGISAKDAVLSIFSSLDVLVVGDIILDRYLVGTCERISPEAPVPVVLQTKNFSTLGGAANVGANFAALNLKVELAGAVGPDAAGDEVIAMAISSGIGVQAIQRRNSIVTTVKTRVIASERQIVRVDQEDLRDHSADESDELVEKILGVVDARKVSAVVISDYAKGVCTPYFCENLIRELKVRAIPIFVDPKGRNYDKYRGVSAIKPNRAEMIEVSKGYGWDTSDVVDAARSLLARLNLEFVALTLGAQGMVLVTPESTHQVPTVAREVYDVSGAGDTVIATMVAALAAGLSKKDALALATVAAGEVVSYVGARPIRKDELLVALQAHTRGDQGRKSYSIEDLSSIVEMWKRQGLRVGFTNGCFDLLHAGHVQLLEDSAARVDKLIVAINSDASVKRLKGPSRPLMSEPQRIKVLCALEVIDAVIVFEEDTPLRLISAIKPNVLIKGGDYTRETVVGADIVEELGGKIELIPLVPGISTSYLAAAIEKL